MKCRINNEQDNVCFKFAHIKINRNTQDSFPRASVIFITSSSACNPLAIILPSRLLKYYKELLQYENLLQPDSPIFLDHLPVAM